MFDHSGALKYYMSFLSPEEQKKTYRLESVAALEKLNMTEYSALTAIETPDSKISYESLWHDVGCIRKGLMELGIQKGQFVGISLPNNANCVKCFLAVMTMGAVAAMLPAVLSGTALENPCRLLRPAVVITNLADVPCASVTPEKLLESDFAPAASIAPSDPAAAFFTGGTSGIPKSCLLTHSAMMTGSFNGIFVPDGAYFQRYYALMPFTHVFGSIRNMLTCLQTGSTLCMSTGMMRLVADLQAYRPTLLVLVPALAQMLLDVVKAYGPMAIGGAVKTIISGSAPIAGHIAEGFNEFGIKLYSGYGLTETANLVTGNVDQLTKPHSVGKLYADQEIRFVDGEIQLKGPHIFTEYINNPAETRNAFDDGWFKTGDLGYLDEEGYLYITGRIKNYICLDNGEKISPEEPEMLVSDLKQVRACLVTLKENRFGAKVLSCEVLPEKGANPEEIEKLIFESVNPRLPAAAQIQMVSFRTEDFKRTPSMKIVREQ
ncbi:MAG: acyl--CoA ligase [Clostridia bacterium]|nr:acyl--CoA ligase [Clostridia bacterium]